MKVNGKFTVSTLTSVWTHLITEADAKDIVVSGVFSSTGKDTHSPDAYSWDVADKMIKIDFGVETFAGYALYSYDDGLPEPEPETPTGTTSGIVINNTQNCNCQGGAAPVDATFPVCG